MGQKAGGRGQEAWREYQIVLATRPVSALLGRVIRFAADPVTVAVKAMRIGCSNGEILTPNISTVQIGWGRRNAKIGIGRVTVWLSLSDSV